MSPVKVMNFGCCVTKPTGIFFEALLRMSQSPICRTATTSRCASSANTITVGTWPMTGFSRWFWIFARAELLIESVHCSAEPFRRRNGLLSVFSGCGFSRRRPLFERVWGCSLNQEENHYGKTTTTTKFMKRILSGILMLALSAPGAFASWVQWTAASGGNNHYYQVVSAPDGIDWLAAETQGEAMRS